MSKSTSARIQALDVQDATDDAIREQIARDVLGPRGRERRSRCEQLRSRALKIEKAVRRGVNAPVRPKRLPGADLSDLSGERSSDHGPRRPRSDRQDRDGRLAGRTAAAIADAASCRRGGDRAGDRQSARRQGGHRRRGDGSVGRRAAAGEPGGRGARHAGSGVGVGTARTSSSVVPQAAEALRRGEPELGAQAEVADIVAGQRARSKRPRRLEARRSRHRPTWSGNGWSRCLPGTARTCRHSMS